MKTLIPLNLKILFEYDIWQNANPNNWNITSYLNKFYDINAALALCKLYFPDFVEIKNCIIIGFRFDEKIFEQWYEEFNGDVSSVEKYCNLYDVADYFQINTIEYESEDLYKKSIDELSNILKSAWEINLKLLYPDKKIVVEVFEEYDVKRITMYSVG